MKFFRKNLSAESLAALKNPGGGPPGTARFNFYLITLANSILAKPDDALDALRKTVGDADPDTLDARA